jgi:hypothetical protein
MEKNNFKATIDSGKNYWCTWASQGYVGKNKMFGKVGDVSLFLPRHYPFSCLCSVFLGYSPL